MSVVALRPAPVAAPAPVPAAPVDVAVHRIVGGHVTSGTVRSRLPYDMQRTHRHAPAPVLPHAAATLAALVAVATRCAPWVAVYAGPRIWRRLRSGEVATDYKRVRRLPSDGSVWREISGVACCRPHVPPGASEVVLVTTWCGTAGAVATLHHEVWHVTEYHLHPSDLAHVTAAVARGVPLPGDYLDSPVERRARLYEAWASAVDEGWRPGRRRRLDRILSYVHGGGLARDVTAGRPARCQRAWWHSVALWLHWCLLQPESAPYPL